MKKILPACNIIRAPIDYDHLAQDDIDDGMGGQHILQTELHHQGSATYQQPAERQHEAKRGW